MNLHADRNNNLNWIPVHPPPPEPGGNALAVMMCAIVVAVFYCLVRWGLTR